MSHHDTKLAKEAPSVAAALAHLRTKDAGDPLEILATRVGDITDLLVKRLEAAEGKITKVGGTVDGLDKKMARLPDGRQDRGGEETWGQQFAHNEAVKRFADDRSRPSRLRLDVKSTITSEATSGGPLGTPTRDAAVILPQRRMTIRDLLPTITVSSNSVEYPVMTTRPSAAATVAEGALKPESAMGFRLDTTPTQVIAHWVPASRQVLEDAPQLAGIIDGELRYGLALAEEAQLLNGNGVSPNLRGLISAATAYVDPMLDIGSISMLDQIGLAILQTALADHIADGIVMHPADWMRIRLMKNADGNYILGPPQVAVQPNLFGVPVVETKAIAKDKFLVGEFKAAATHYERWEARVEVSTEHADFFTRNLIVLLGEMRVGLGIKQPLALTYGDFGLVA